MRLITAIFFAMLLVFPAAGHAQTAPMFEKPGQATTMAKSILATLKPWQKPLAIRITPEELAIAVLGTDTRSIVWHRARNIRNNSVLGILLGSTRLEISGPEKADSDDDTGQRDFELADVPLQQLPKIITDAFRPAGIAKPNVTSLFIARRGHWSAKTTGPLRIVIRAATGKGAITVLAAADGKPLGTDLSGLASDERIPLFEQDWAFRIAAEELAMSAPEGAAIREISISRREVSMLADDAENPGKSHRWSWSMAGVRKSVNAIDTDVLMKRKTRRFRFDQARIAEAPAMIAEARKALNAPKARLDSISIKQPEAGVEDVIHEIALIYPERDKGKVRFNAAGALISTEIPESRRPAESRTLSAIYERTILDLERSFGRDVRIVSIDLRDDGSGIFTLEDPQKPGSMAQFIMNNPGEFVPFGSVWPDKDLANAFTLADFRHIDGIGITNASRVVLQTFGKSAERVERLMISRATPFNRAKNNAVMMEFRTIDSTGNRAGWIILDVVEGKRVAVMRP